MGKIGSERDTSVDGSSLPSQSRYLSGLNVYKDDISLNISLKGRRRKKRPPRAILLILTLAPQGGGAHIAKRNGRAQARKQDERRVTR